MKYQSTQDSKIFVEAKQWFKDGDHVLVKKFSNPDFEGSALCLTCGMKYEDHGFLMSYKPHKVCRGNMIIESKIGISRVMGCDLFHHIYKEVKE